MRIILFILLLNVLNAQGIPAGTKIENQAQLNYSLGSANFTIASNKVIDIVDQKIDMKMICQESTPIIVGVAETKRALSFRLTNRGNGSDSYSFLEVNDASSDFEVQNRELYLDNGDGVFSVVNDTLVSDVNLSADESTTLFFVSDIPSDADGFSSNGIKVHSELQGNLLYGDSKNLGTYYAVMTAKEDALSDLCSYEVSHLAIDLEKTATLSSDKPYVGSTIHYSIAVKVIGTGKVEDIVVEDIIPDGTAYVPNTLQLDGVAFGDFNGTAIRIEVDEIEQVVASSDPRHTITFDVKIL